MACPSEAVLAFVDQTHGEFEARLAHVSDEDWHRPTPCDGWDVSQLVEHVASAALIYVALIEGTPFEEAMRTSPSVSSAALPTHCLEAADQLRSALGRPGGMTAECDVPGGPITGAGLATVRIFDVTVHCWDLSRALGLPDELPEALVHHSWRYAVSHYGDQAAEAASTGTSSPAAALIRITGRVP